MKKIFLILVSIFIFSKCYALEYKYSEWSPIYPGKVKDEIFIEKEDRFLWYKYVQKDIKYKRIEDLSDLINVDYKDIKYETNYSLEEPFKYKERTYSTEFNNYEFDNSEINGMALERIGNIDIAEIEIYLNGELTSFKKSVSKLTDGEYNYINYMNKNVKFDLNEFNESIKLVFHYNSYSDETMYISYRAADRYNVYSSKVTFNECYNCTKEITINDLRSYKNQYIPVYKYTDKLYKTYKLDREYTDEYYSYLDGYIKDESTLKPYYRFIMKDYIVVNNRNELVHNNDYCSKEACIIKYKDMEIENPKTSDNIYLYSNSIILIIFLIIKKYLVLSKHNISFNNYSNI